MIPPGSIAPRFTLPDQDDEPFSVDQWAGKSNVLLLFLPRAFTPICSTELPALGLYRERFWREANCVVAAVTADGCPANREWARRCETPEVFVLSDCAPSGAVSKAYGAWIESESIPDRATVIIDPRGVVRYSESVGKYGKRSIPALLQVASAVNGSPIPAPQTVRMPLDLPILFFTSTCPHCHAVRARIQQLRIEDKIVPREVDSDQSAYEQLLSIEPQAGVPTLYWNGQTFTGGAQIEPLLQQIASLAAAA